MILFRKWSDTRNGAMPIMTLHRNLKESELEGVILSVPEKCYVIKWLISHEVNYDPEIGSDSHLKINHFCPRHLIYSAINKINRKKQEYNQEVTLPGCLLGLMFQILDLLATFSNSCLTRPLFNQ